MDARDAEDELVVRLLGDPEVRRGAAPHRSFESARLRSLLGFLIVGRDRPIARRRLAFELWPDSGDAQARTNLRQALHHLRHALGDADRYLRIDGQSVRWLPDGPVDVDVVAFEAAAAAGLDRGDEQELARAADRYRGDLLAGCYDEWVGPERDRLRSLAGRVLHALAAAAAGRGDWAGAVHWGDRLLRHDPLDEAAHRAVIAAHAAAGERVRALRRYHECVTVLDRELGVAPDEATVALYDALVADPSCRHRPDAPDGFADRTPLIGRDAELRELVATWGRAAAGRTSFVLITGEPGIGKTRLVDELVAVCRRGGAATVATRAYEAEGDRPYGPVLDLLAADPMRASVAALDPRLQRELARALPSAGGPGTPGDDGHGDRRGLFEAIGRVLVVPGRRLVLAVDDLHWCDPDTIDLLEHVLRTATSSASPILVVGTVRAEELASDAALRQRVGRLHAAAGSTNELPLPRLDACAARALVDRVARTRAGEDPGDRIVEAAGGNPLFLVEMARSGLADPRPGDGAPELPPRVQAVIDARLDRLSGPARALAAAAAVVGRSFTIELISRLADDETAAVTALDELWRRGIVRERGVDSYDFGHDRIRDVAYRRIGPARRCMLHAAVADAIRASSAPEPGLIAHHLEQAGRVDEAIAAYRDAVAASARAFAHQDVIGTCRRALRLVAGRPPGPRRDDDELAFLVPLGVALMAGPGIHDRDLEVYRQARALRSRRGLSADPSTLRLSANAAIGRREYRRARRFAETLLQQGLDAADDLLITEGHYLLGVTSFWLADLDASSRSLQDALAAHDVRNTPVHLERFGQDPRSVCLVRGALTAFHRGDDVAAAAGCARALEACGELAHDYTDLYVRMFAAWYLADSGRPGAAADVVAGMPPTSPNTIAPIARALFPGWARTDGGDPAAGVRLLLQAHQVARRNGPQMFEPYALLLLASSRWAGGQPAAALADARAARRIATAEMPFHVPEATRLVGELELATGGDPVRALARLDAAAGAAAHAGALVHEIRARTSALRAARTHSPASVDARTRLLAGRCAALPAGAGLADLDAAVAELG
jgi:DNA-binding SARP family transcriptional activator